MTRINIPRSASLAMEMHISQSSEQAMAPLRIISHNVRYATTHPVAGEERWSVRCPMMVNQLSFITTGHENAFICLQECLHSQVHDLQDQLGDTWGHIGRGRGEHPRDGEFSPIFYKQNTWRCEREETRWLSKTPEKPSRGWDAVLNRIVTMGEFSHVVNGTRVIVMSTHFDHIGVTARQRSAELLIKFAKEWSSESEVSVVLIGGDFNSEPTDGAYKTITAPGSGMVDISDLVPKSQHYGNHLTYTSFGEGWDPSRIDFLFIQEPRTAKVNTFGVLSNSHDDGILTSDHRPVVADLDIVV
ncbi:Endonuclease/exonuclease/phosphatase [Thelonectria olida]|uniref:Endonuclease/exonuclease/phosphatase n=1 Tax=Thelonectria olida TaxID=1576542 RepID=A0A9P8W777_9HYPO|nr:Endonuclease/exonuclease/phosphatase [Thelonectria olida]